ncbi:MAG: SGNH/GDSL hydrolase family protein [Vulcanimicrobiota bacterium]
MRYVALGDSLTAGFQDLTLCGESQVKGFPQLIADAADIDFETPAVGNPGAPPCLFRGGRATAWHALGQVCKVALGMALPGAFLAGGWVPPESTLLPLNWLLGSRQASQRPADNLGVPGFELRHLETIANTNDLMAEMAGRATFMGQMPIIAPVVKAVLQQGGNCSQGKSAVTRAVEANPDLITLWAGSNDALEPALMGHVDDQTLTPLEDKRWTYHAYNPLSGTRTPYETQQVMPGFRSSLDSLVTRLLKETSAEILMMNLPDVTLIPYLREVGQPVGRLPFRVVTLGGKDITESLENWKIPDEVRSPQPGARDRFPAGTKVGLGFVLAKFSSKEQRFTEDEVLDPDELETIRERTAEFNQLIEQAANSSERIHLVDVAALLQRSRNGVALRGEGPEDTVINNFAGVRNAANQDGYFSYDGIHPSDVGHAILANEMLTVARAKLSENPRFGQLTNASLIDEKAIHADDPRTRPVLVLR